MIRIGTGIVVLVLAGSSWAAQPHAVQQPPAQWADYIAAVRKADAIEDDEARCVAMPDLPGNAWRPGASKWRCSILRKPMLSLDEIDALLKRDGGATELDRRFATLLDANFNDLAQRDQIFIAFHPFDDSTRAGEVAERWLQQSPRSAFAHAAVGMHHDSAGWKARGLKYVHDTSQAQLDRMAHKFVQAIPEYLEALKIEPRLSPACTSLAAIGRQSSDRVQAYAMAACTKVDPDSYFVTLERIYEAQPKWGGSDEALRVAVAYAEARVDKNPMLAALLGEGAGYEPSMADDEVGAADALAAAVSMGPSGYLSRAAGRAFRAKGDPWTALAYQSQAVRFRPRDEADRYARAGTLWALGDLDWAYRDMQVALEVAPDDGWDNYRMGQLVRLLKSEKEARPFFRHAMDVTESRRQAMAMYCQGFVMEPASSSEAADCTRDMVAEYPEDGEGWRLRFWTLSQAKDPEAQHAAEMFLRYADANDAFQQQAIPGIRRWLQMQQHPQAPHATK
jgi:tetratricopeptide (TPR) repeat protein